MGNFPSYAQYFGSNIVEGVAESWVEAEMSMEEVDAAGWRWVHDIVMPISVVLCMFLFKMLLFKRRIIEK